MKPHLTKIVLYPIHKIICTCGHSQDIQHRRWYPHLRCNRHCGKADMILLYQEKRKQCINRRVRKPSKIETQQCRLHNSHFSFGLTIHLEPIFLLYYVDKATTLRLTVSHNNLMSEACQQAVHYSLFIATNLLGQVFTKCTNHTVQTIMHN